VTHDITMYGLLLDTCMNENSRKIILMEFTCSRYSIFIEHHYAMLKQYTIYCIIIM